MNQRQLRAYWRKQDRKKLAYERKYIRRFRRALANQIKPVLDYINQVQDPRVVVNQIDTLITKDEIEKVFTDLHYEVGLDFLRSSARGLKSSYGIMTTKQDEDEFLEYWQLVIQRYIREDALDDIVTILETSRDDALRIIQNIISQGLEEGWGIDEYSREMRKQIPKEWRKRLFRAEVIARTETGAAASFGSHQGALSTGLEFDKVWLAISDSVTRDSHSRVNGERRKLRPDEAFSNGLLYPNQKGAPAEEVINCRCNVGYVRPL